MFVCSEWTYNIASCIYTSIVFRLVQVFFQRMLQKNNMIFVISLNNLVIGRGVVFVVIFGGRVVLIDFLIDFVDI